MDTYNVIISSRALSQLEDYHNYILLTLINEQAAQSVWEDAMQTVERLTAAAGSLRFCGNKELQKMGYRCIRFKSHRYVMLYRIESRTVYVDAVYHQLQNYEALFSESLE